MAPAATTQPPNETGASKWRWSPWWILVLALTAYAPAFEAGYVNWDDDLYIRDNPLLQDWRGLWRIWTTLDAPQYYPVTFSSFWLEYRLWGAAPEGYHATNIALQALNALLVYALSRRLGAAPRAAFVAGTLFAVHPLQVASVVWLPERKNLLAGAFLLAALLLYLRHVRKGSWQAHGAALASFGLALLSKTAVAALPLAFLAADRFVLGQPWRAALRRIVPFFLLAAVLAFVTITAEGAGPPDDLAWGLRPLAAAGAIWFYVAKLFVPAHLLAVYPHWDITIAAGWLWAALAGLILATLAIWHYRERLDGRVIWALVHFLAGLLPAVGLIRFGYLRYAPVADHFVYFAVIGPFVLAGLAFEKLVTRPGTRRSAAAAASYAMLGILGVLVALSCRASWYWCDAERLWGRLVDAVPDSPVGNNQYGFALAEQGRHAAAAGHYAAAVASWPEYSDAQRNLGAALLQLGRPAEARQALQRAVALDPEDPRARFNLTLALLAGNDVTGALNEASIGVQRTPQNALSHAALGAALAARGEAELAAEHFRRALELDVRTWQARAGLARLLAEAGQLSQAITEQGTALTLKPGDAELTSDLAHYLALDGNFSSAAGLYQQVVAARPDDANAWCQLGLTLERSNQAEKAVTAFRQSLALQPSWVPASRLAWLLATDANGTPGATAEAVRLAEQARELAGAERALVLDPLAAAYAAAGRSAEAVACAQRALSLARAAGQQHLAGEIESRLAEYRAGRPHIRR